MRSQLLRLAAYAVCIDDDNRMLLARYVSPDRSQQHWTLPGGGVEQGEDPFDAVVREVGERAGYRVEVDRLLGVDSRTLRVDRAGGELHTVGVFYGVTIGGGEITEHASWVPVGDIAEAERSVVVDVALELHRGKPAHGHVEPIKVNGLIRD